MTEATASANGSTPTVILVHGAFAESASWNGVIRPLQDGGYTAFAVPNELRSVASDADFVASILKSLPGPILLVGHSYGGAVITNAARDNENVKALVYVAGFAPEEGENIGELSAVRPAAPLERRCGPSRCPTAATTSTSSRTSTTSSSPPT
jgi:pimeloyl-ACP methyl ester carboxylesterase